MHQIQVALLSIKQRTNMNGKTFLLRLAKIHRRTNYPGNNLQNNQSINVSMADKDTLFKFTIDTFEHNLCPKSLNKAQTVGQKN